MKKRLALLLILTLVCTQCFNFIVHATSENVYINLGTFTLNGNSTDNQYDWGNCTIKTGGIYKTWWTRGDPHDTIWYAESTDGVHWYGARKVLTASESTWEKMHVADPSVVYYNNRYYMFYESNYTVTPEASDSNILLATSADGINWNKYPDNSNPQPVIQTPTALLGQGYYGVGQPCVFVKNSQFVMYYTYAAEPLAGPSGGNFITRTVSSDGYTWAGSSDTHPRLVVGAGADVRFSTELNKYVMTFTLDNQTGHTIPPPDSEFNYGMHVVLSTDGITWPATTFWDMATSTNNITVNEPRQTRCFASVVTNPSGILEGKTFYSFCATGDIHLPSEDFKVNCSTWDGDMFAVKLSDFENDALYPPEYSNFKSVSNGSLFRLTGTTKYSYISWDAFTAANNGRTDYFVLPDDIVSTISNGENFYEGLNIKSNDSGTVYKISGGKKCAYVNLETYNAINGSNPTVFTVDASIINQFSSGPYYLEGLNIKGESTGSIYKVLNGKKCAYASWETYLVLNNNVSIYYTIPDSVVNQLENGLYHVNGLNVKSESGAEILYCYNSLKYNYSSWGYFLDKTKNAESIYSIPDSVFQNIQSTFIYGGYRP
ncbi:MAG: glycoside hydrolase family protein [Saccharofermentanales bacterium]